MYALFARSTAVDSAFGWIMALLLAGSGAYCLIAAITGWSRIYEESKNPAMQQQLQRIGKTKARILHSIGGAVMLGFGMYLLHGLLFVQQ